MNAWQLLAGELREGPPEILSTTDDSRAIALHLRAGEELQEHEVHERAWLVVVDGEVEIEDAGGTATTGGAGLVAEFAPAERHSVRARSDARMLLLLVPWPGNGHPGAMTLEQKAAAREAAAARNSA